MTVPKILSRTAKRDDVVVRGVRKAFGRRALLVWAIVAGLAVPGSASAITFLCTWKTNGVQCLYSPLNANQASGWSPVRSMFSTVVYSGNGNFYLKGIAWYRNGTMYGWWYGGAGDVEFRRTTNPIDNVVQQDICRNGHGTLAQNMTCLSVQ